MIIKILLIIHLIAPIHSEPGDTPCEAIELNDPLPITVSTSTNRSTAIVPEGAPICHDSITEYDLVMDSPGTWYKIQNINDLFVVTSNYDFDAQISIYEAKACTDFATFQCVDGSIWCDISIVCEYEGTCYACAFTPVCYPELYILVHGDDATGTTDVVVEGFVGGCDPNFEFPSNVRCADMVPICAADDFIDLRFIMAGQVDPPQASDDGYDPNNDYDCVTSQKNPNWFYFQVSESGSLKMNLSANADVDYIIYGPFFDLSAAIGKCGTLESQHVVACDYSKSNGPHPDFPRISEIEFIEIDVQSDETYIFLITNYANKIQRVNLIRDSRSTANTDCSIVPVFVPTTSQPDQSTTFTTIVSTTSQTDQHTTLVQQQDESVSESHSESHSESDSESEDNKFVAAMRGFSKTDDENVTEILIRFSNKTKFNLLTITVILIISIFISIYYCCYEKGIAFDMDGKVSKV